MIQYFRDYVWKKGVPQGAIVVSEEQVRLEPTAYRIVTDPYRKRITLEKYAYGCFDTVVYDSALLDLRNLTLLVQPTWKREVLEETPEKKITIIRNEDHRVVLKEIHLFEQGVSRECHLISPQGLLIAVEKIYRKSQGNPFDGLALFDQEGRPVMLKRYAVDGQGDFVEALEEVWDMSK